MAAQMHYSRGHSRLNAMDHDRLECCSESPICRMPVVAPLCNSQSTRRCPNQLPELER